MILVGGIAAMAGYLIHRSATRRRAAERRPARRRGRERRRRRDRATRRRRAARTGTRCRRRSRRAVDGRGGADSTRPPDAPWGSDALPPDRARLGLPIRARRDRDAIREGRGSRSPPRARRRRPRTKPPTRRRPPTDEVETQAAASRRSSRRPSTRRSQLIKAGKRDLALASLRALWKKRPQSAYIPFLLGNLYFDQRGGRSRWTTTRSRSEERRLPEQPDAEPQRRSGCSQREDPAKAHELPALHDRPPGACRTSSAPPSTRTTRS